MRMMMRECVEYVYILIIIPKVKHVGKACGDSAVVVI